VPPTEAETMQADTDNTLADEILVEEISTDGMCGVY
jgi:mycofactocin precursor